MPRSTTLPPGDREFFGLISQAAVANPFSYGVDLLKHACSVAHVSTPASGHASFAPDFTPGVDLLVLSGFVLVGTTLAAWRFANRSTIAILGRLIGRGGGG